jgi:hypothetical protein
VGLLLTEDPATADAIMRRIEAHSGIDPEAVLRGTEARIDGYRRLGLQPPRATILFAVDAALDDLSSAPASGSGPPVHEPRSAVAPIDVVPQVASAASSRVHQRDGAGPHGSESRPLLALTLVQLLSQSSPEIEWQIQDILPVEGVGILAGPPGCGKTWMLGDLAIEVSRGGFWLGHFPTRRGTVICIDEESPAGLLPVRYRKLLLAKGLSTESVDVHFCMGQGFSFSRPGDVARLREVLARIGPSLVIVDSLIRVHSAEENSASEMSAVFAVLKALARAFHCAFLFADHIRKGKSGETGLDQMVRGSTDKAAFVDTLLVATKSEVGVVVEHVKSRFAEALPGFVVTLEDPQPGTTSVKYVGDAKALKQERLRALAAPVVEDALEGGDWVPRQKIVDLGAKAGVTKKAIDAILAERVEQGNLERDNRRPEGGKGNKLAFYRLQRNGGSLKDDPVPGFPPTNTGETETGSDEVLVTGRPLPKDPVPGSPSISKRETGTGSQEES